MKSVVPQLCSICELQQPLHFDGGTTNDDFDLVTADRIPGCRKRSTCSVAFGYLLLVPIGILYEIAKLKPQR